MPEPLETMELACSGLGAHVRLACVLKHGCFMLFPWSRSGWEVPGATLDALAIPSRHLQRAFWLGQASRSLLFWRRLWCRRAAPAVLLLIITLEVWGCAVAAGELNWPTCLSCGAQAAYAFYRPSLGMKCGGQLAESDLSVF